MWTFFKPLTFTAQLLSGTIINTYFSCSSMWVSPSAPCRTIWAYTWWFKLKPWNGSKVSRRNWSLPFPTCGTWSKLFNFAEPPFPKSKLYYMKTNWGDNRSQCFIQCMCVCVCVCMCSFSQSCLTLCDPMDSSPPGFSAHGVFQARILEWVAISSYRESSWPKGQTCISCIAGRFFTAEP